MVVLRLKRLGRRHRPFYRLNAMDQRSPRDGQVIEELGWFDLGNHIIILGVILFAIFIVKNA